MYNDFFGGFDFNHDGHISSYERATAFHYIDSMNNGHSGSGNRYTGSGSYTRSGYGSSASRTGSKSRSKALTGTHGPSFCNIYGGYYTCRKDKM